MIPAGGGDRWEAMTDEQVMADVASGDQEALQALHRRLAPLVFHIACRSLDAAAAEEITQDVFLRVWQKAATFDPDRGTFRSWILQIAHRRVINELRERGRRPSIDANSEASLVDASAQDSGPEEQVWAQYQKSVIRRALAALPPEQGRALRLAYFQDLTHEEIAAFLDVPLGTAKGRIRLALEKLNAPLAALVALLVAGVGLGAYAWHRRQSSLALDERALAMLTSSHMEALRLEPLAFQGEIEQGSHATYRAERGGALIVFTLSNLPRPSDGETYRLWRLSAGAWKALGDLRPGPTGHGRLLIEAPEAVWPEALVLTRERRGSIGAVPAGERVLAWRAGTDRP
ncbi:RNA polymerase sigma factor [Mesoterricola silvestris]|uniref:RNA polymerase sigma factor n=1 Tax=Mesoterricola silvestris TaxID=2927979 RepID=A0AA48GUK6_9BACT|nr:sigma-70 family RNA polymerase sigma factor [Mesoterricola silvestris]BDU74342.1 hypothetical protein METEAL_35160 [Mesoterricola silvestris]